MRTRFVASDVDVLYAPASVNDRAEYRVGEWFGTMSRIFFCIAGITPEPVGS